MKTTMAATKTYRSGWILFLIILSLCLAGCGSDTKLGDHCGSHSDCPGICQTGGDFPEGICTQNCDSNDDCPAGWSCITEGSGICLKDCTSTAQCEERFGVLWQCDDETLHSSGLDTLVCIGD